MNSHNPHDFRNRPRRTTIDFTPLRTERLDRNVRTLTSDSLFRGDYEIGIDHGGSLYRLKITRQGKLILNK